MLPKHKIRQVFLYTITTTKKNQFIITSFHKPAMLEKLTKPDLSVNDKMGILISYWGYCTVVSFYLEGTVTRG